MAELEVVWSHFAKSQRDEIFKYWNHRNKSNYFSKKLRLKIKSKTEQLKIQPLSGKEIGESSCRILIFGNYSLVYKHKSFHFGTTDKILKNFNKF